MAQPHPPQLFKLAKRPCWHCGTRHESDTIPALCSDPCREAWTRLYQLTYAEPTEILSGPMSPGLVKAPVTAAGQVRSGLQNIQINPPVKLNAGDQVVVHTNHGRAVEPVLEEQDDTVLGDAIRRWRERHRAVPQDAQQGVPHSPDWRPADEPQDLVGGPAEAGVALQPKPRPSWWRRWLRRG